MVSVAVMRRSVKEQERLIQKMLDEFGDMVMWIVRNRPDNNLTIAYRKLHRTRQRLNRITNYIIADLHRK